MDTINKEFEKEPVAVRAIQKSNSVKRRVTKSIMNSTGMIVGFFLLFVVVVVFTTDINISSFEVIAQLGLTFFILFFCSYSMYINFVDSGLRAGRQTEAYLAALGAYDELKHKVVESQLQSRLCEFCRHFVDVELKTTRNNILTEVGVPYELYASEFVGKDKATLQKDKRLSKTQIDAIVKANSTKPITLTPEMIMKRGRGSSGRSPLGQKPETKRRITYGVKFITTFVTSVLTGVIVLDVIADPTWATFAECLMKILPVVLNGFFGYKMGYENITIDTVHYVNDQSDLLQQFRQYVAEFPVPVPKYALNGLPDTAVETESANEQEKIPK